MGIKTFKYRLYPTPAQEKCMFNTLAVCRHFYNMCLEDRKWSYELAVVASTPAPLERWGFYPLFQISYVA